jgi:hypothetical protein
MLTPDSNKKFVLCITNEFTKYAVEMAIQNKNAETVADTIFKEWFCKFGILAQIHTDGGKELVNKLASKMMELLNVANTKTSLAHPQCNSQVKVFYKTVKKYLALFVDDMALNWETFLPTLALRSLGLTLSPGAKTSKSSLQVVIETVQRLSISCGIISWLCCRGDTSLVSATMGEISFCCIALLMYLLGQYLRPCLSVQG